MATKSKPEAALGSRRMSLAAGVVFLLGAGARLAFLAWQGPKINPDSEKYLALARNLLAHGIYSLDAAMPLTPSVRFPPLYPTFIATLSLSGHSSPLAIAVAQAILGALTAVMMLLLALRVLPFNWACFVALTYALHPGGIASASAILTETLFTAIVVCAIWVLAGSLQKNNLWLTAAGGLMLGLAILCRSMVLLLPFGIFGVILLQRRRRSFAHGLALIIGALLVIAPWTIRSSRVAGRLITVQDQYAVAAAFYVATRWDWNQNLVCWSCFTEEAKGLVAAARRSDDGEKEELRADKILLSKGIQGIRQSPGEYVASRARSFPYLFLSSYDSFTGIYRSYGILLAERDVLRLSAKLFLLFVFSLAPFLLGVVGLISSVESTPAMLCASVWVYMLVFHIPLWVEPRYWLPAIPFLLLSAGFGASKLWHRFGKRVQET
jgi:4-amino-4-deoxy-L-arabinose transferase-like glycosyltransferase